MKAGEIALLSRQAEADFGRVSEEELALLSRQATRVWRPCFGQGTCPPDSGGQVPCLLRNYFEGTFRGLSPRSFISGGRSFGASPRPRVVRCGCAAQSP